MAVSWNSWQSSPVLAILVSFCFIIFFVSFYLRKLLSIDFLWLERHFERENQCFIYRDITRLGGQVISGSHPIVGSHAMFDFSSEEKRWVTTQWWVWSFTLIQLSITRSFFSFCSWPSPMSFIASRVLIGCLLTMLWKIWLSPSVGSHERE